MKRFGLSILFLFFAVAIFAQNGNVPAAVKNAFSAKYPNVEPTWIQANDGFRANFVKEGKDICALFHDNGDYINSATKVNLTDLPSAIQNDIQTRFSNYQLVECRILSNADGSINYEYQYQSNNMNVEVFFDAAGTIVRRNIVN